MLGLENFTSICDLKVEAFFYPRNRWPGDKKMSKVKNHKKEEKDLRRNEQFQLRVNQRFLSSIWPILTKN